MRSIQSGGLVTVLVSLALCAGPAASAQTPDKPASPAPAASPAPPASPAPATKPAAKKPAAAAQPGAKPAASLTFPVPGTKNLTYSVEADWGKCLPVNTAPAGVSIPEHGGTLVVICTKNGVASAKVVRVN